MINMKSNVKELELDVSGKVLEESPHILQVTVYEDENHRIYFEKKSRKGLVYCYVDGQRVVFVDDVLDSGAKGMYYHRPANCRYVYIIGSIFDSENKWETFLHIYRMDTRALTLKHIGNYATIRFEDNGFKTTTARLLNPDAECMADKKYAIRDYFFDYNGKLIKRGKNEYERIYNEHDYALKIEGDKGIDFLDII